MLFVSGDDAFNNFKNLDLRGIKLQGSLEKRERSDIRGMLFVSGVRYVKEYRLFETTNFKGIWTGRKGKAKREDGGV